MKSNAKIAPGGVGVLDPPDQSFDVRIGLIRGRMRSGRFRAKQKKVVFRQGKIAEESGLCRRQIEMNPSQRNTEAESEEYHSAFCQERRFQPLSSDVLFHDIVGGLQPFELLLEERSFLRARLPHV